MFDFFREIYSSIRQHSMERVKSPVLGAFVFSWLGFNWQMLAILFFSKQDIEERINSIQSHHDISSYLIGPIFTTILISFFLPRANKLFTLLQNKPNQETIKLTIDAKKDLAERQQEIAEIDAKKRLALKIAEKEIEENISKIKSQNAILSSEVKKSEEENEKLSKWLEEEKELTKKLNLSLAEQYESINKYSNETLSLISKLEEKNNELSILSNDKLSLESELNNTKIELEKIKFTSEHALMFHMQLRESYPHLFQPDESGQYALIRYKIHDKLVELDSWAKDML
ncbi:TPA: hypothetical protein OUA31_000915 [Klebsiella aerogenes]|nr:hypothetical protein [Klebsiella aerogenes]HCT8623288.1 hypothetical protein [Klebsiella aerogenes]HCT8632292.1 hypothetical protein [Klebsiella aerogenes]HCT8713501.1 hypothetical protein [Klebsiella aerogenes]